MRVAILLTWVLIAGGPVFSQHNIIDSLQIVLKNQKTDTGRAIALYNLSYAYQVYKPDTALLLAQEAYYLSVKHHYLDGESWSLNQMAGAFSRMGNNSQALEYYLKQLQIEEERKSPYDIATINMNIALVYNREKDTAKAIAYMLKADSVINSNKLSDLDLYGLLNTGDIFEKAGRLREALSYTRQCYELAMKKNDSLMIGSALNNLGNIYLRSHDFEKAISNYRLSVPFLVSMNDNQTISEGKLGMANAFEKLGLVDSAFTYAGNAYSMAMRDGFLKNALSASTLLYQLYKQQHNTDSAFAYQETNVSLKDSIQSIEKIKQLENITIAEQLRQQQLRAAEEQEKEEAKQRLQLLAIGIAIPICFLISMYISRKRVHRKVIEYSGVVSLLLLFEYITLFIHPFVAEVTHHSPLLEIIILVGIAALVVPAHHKIESMFIKRLAKIHEHHLQVPPALQTPAAPVKENEAMNDFEKLENEEGASPEDDSATAPSE